MGDLLRQLGRAMTGRTGVPVRVASKDEWTLPPDVQMALYRIAQEAGLLLVEVCAIGIGRGCERIAVNRHDTFQKENIAGESFNGRLDFASAAADYALVGSIDN